MSIIKLTRQDKSLFKKLAYTLFVVVTSIVLAHIPVYGIDSSTLQLLFQQQSILTFSDILTGGSLSQLAVGGFGVSSIIMAGILMQLIGIIIPRIEQIQGDGEFGRVLFNRITFGLAIVMTCLSVAITLISGTVTYNGIDAWWCHCIPVIEWIVGSVIIIWLAQHVHDYGIGNGPTIILAANIAGRVVPECISYFNIDTQTTIILTVALLASIIIGIYFQAGVINIRVQQTAKQLSIMNADGVVPMPVAISSVLPIVYASSFMMMPALYSAFTGHDGDIITEVLKFTNAANWYDPTCWENVVGLVLYIFMIFGFSLYSSKLGFSSDEVANRMREKGDVIPGIRPGEETERYLAKRRTKVSLTSAVMLVIITIVPDIALTQLGVTSFSFMGTSLIILIAAFWDMRLRLKGMTKHWNKRYTIFHTRAKHKAGA